MKCAVGLFLVTGFPALILISSCASHRPEITLDTTAVDATALISLVREHANRLTTLEGSGTVTFDSPSFGGSAAFSLSMRKPDSLLVLFEGPFGIDVGTLFLSRDKYLIYNSLQNLVVTGVPRSNTLRTVIPFDLTVDEILNAFSGAFEIPDGPAHITAYRINDDRFLISLDCGDRICSYWIDNRYLQVAKYEVHDRAGELLMQATSSSFTEEGDASAPRRIEVWFPQDDRQIAVFYSSITLNPPRPSFVYTVPVDARTVVR